jgi:hypothetical protein
VVLDVPAWSLDKKKKLTLEDIEVGGRQEGE